jgi:hypothetical protein
MMPTRSREKDYLSALEDGGDDCHVWEVGAASDWVIGLQVGVLAGGLLPRELLIAY